MTDTLVTERIEANLTRLRLPRIREILDRIIESAEQKSQSYLSFLDDLLEEEVAQKEQRRIETALKISGVPSIKGIGREWKYKREALPEIPIVNC